MKKSIAIMTISVMVFCSTGLATIINIPDDYPTIQAGIDASVDGDTVLVQPGIYVENLLIDSKDIVLGSLFLTTEDTSYISQTIVDGDSANTVVQFSNCAETTTTVTGLTIRNGYGSTGGGGIKILASNPLISHNLITENVAFNHGGGIYIFTDANPIIFNNRIVDNTANFPMALMGGGISCYSDNAIISFNIIYGNYASSGGAIAFGSAVPTNTIISNNHIYENTAHRGGGIFIHTDGCYVEITDNIISDNDADSIGGAICVHAGSNPVISGNMISGNSASWAGCGIYCISASPTISNNMISHNVQTGGASGGGLSLFGGSNATIHQNLIYGNFANAGGGIHCDNSDPTISNNTFFGNLAVLLGQYGNSVNLNASDPIIINSIFWPDTVMTGIEIDLNWNSAPVITYCDIYDTLWSGDGNISVDPMFVNPDTGNFYLLEGSPCIDAGDPSSPYDSDSTIADMGCFYYDQSVGIGEYDEVLPNDYTISQNYPNPFNAVTIIKYELPVQSQVTIDIYDILGRKVTALANSNQPAGYHQVIWKADDVSSGIYFYKLQASNYTETRKMTLVK